MKVFVLTVHLLGASSNGSTALDRTNARCRWADRVWSSDEAVWPLPLIGGLSMTDAVREHSVRMDGDTAARAGLRCLCCRAVRGGLDRGLRI